MGEPLDPAFHLLPAEQIDRVLGQHMCDIDPTFLGFTNIYLALASVIPKHWTIVDLGCAYAPQAFIFKDHETYIGVDLGIAKERFEAGNTTHYTMPIAEFIDKYGADFHQETTFAICSYVPPWQNDNMALARGAFKNVFTYYPASPRDRFIAIRQAASGESGT
ncbi:hypothetical protein SAMN05892877_1077 [Rhizobium subbaraonis]|uniref:Methyltransferase family protein n=1 Tax=Rhizobium subbaraonis TaxID=908946 RepID=A0A285UE80_9HYPH|nr:hypothetical protein [Rhizobium subbaraonis]SOC40109.1 hypothetical protein SAMN05892877_1077 [Rhizobium subbaraonis]